MPRVETTRTPVLNQSNPILKAKILLHGPEEDIETHLAPAESLR